MMTSLDQRLRECERALIEMERRAVAAERLASVSVLTAGITHDIGTPLTAILGYAELIARSVPDEKNCKRATTIVDQVHRVSGLIETLMNLSRAEAGDPRPLELADTLDRALDFYREKFKRRGVKIERHYAAIPQILGDPNKLYHAFLSLFLARLDVMSRGDLLSLTTAKTGDGAAEVRILDSGKHLDPDLEAQIAGSGSGKNQIVGGAALGLLVAKAIVEEHAGRLSLESQPDRGTEFCLRFPGLEA